MQIHLDTDFAGDTDDAAALAMLLGWPDVEVVGITTTADPDGLRAGYVHSFLTLAGRDEIPVAAGAGASLKGSPMGTVPDHEAYWGDIGVSCRRSSEGDAVELMATSVEHGATIVGIGPYTNLAVLEAARPGTLAGARVVLMGGWLQAPAFGLPQWGPEMDWNVQCDTTAAMQLLEAAGALTLVTLSATLTSHLRAVHVERLHASGRIGRLLARQARAHAAENRMTELGRAHAGLPDDLLNFQYDPVACAVALGWPGATTDPLTLQPIIDAGILRFAPVDDGKQVEVVLDVDGAAFADTWLAAIERADSRS